MMLLETSRNRIILEFLETWESIYNPSFKMFEFEHFRKQVALLTITPSVTEWCERTNAIGVYSKIGKYVKQWYMRYQLDILNNAEKIKILNENKNSDWNPNK